MTRYISSRNHAWTVVLLFSVLAVSAAVAAPVLADDKAGLPAAIPIPAEADGTMPANIPVFFTPNSGQADPAVLYTFMGRDFAVFFLKDRIVYALPSGDPGQPGRYIAAEQFPGANPDPIVSGLDPLPMRVSYFTGPEADWHTGIVPYGTIVYRDLYPGTDLIIRRENGAIKREFLVRPGADPGSLRMLFDGGTARIAGDGTLAIRAGSGELQESAPDAWQEAKGQRIHVPCRFDLREDGTVSFVTGPYDPALPLTIDPALAYCGYIGGDRDDTGRGIAVDSAGNAYVTGETYSSEPTFPVTAGPDLSYSGSCDAFVAKVNASGTALDYCGYIGGDNSEWGYAIAVDGSGNAYITGYTDSSESTFPVTVGPDLTSGGNDAFVAKINATGTGLDYCGYIGGSRYDGGRGIAVDGSGNAYVTGETASNETSFPVTVGPDLTWNGGNTGGEGDPLDAFVAKVNASGASLDYCGYIGGSGQDYGYGIVTDSHGNAYVTGSTESSDATFPVNIGPNITYGGNGDAFVVKVNPAGNGRIYSGYIGGSDFDAGTGIAVDTEGNAYVTGYTMSDETSFPVTIGPDLTFNSGMYMSDAFVAKVESGGSGLSYCGYIGGLDYDEGDGIAVDAAGNAYVAGYTYSDETSFPVTIGPDLIYNSRNDAFVAKVESSGSALAYCGYIGGLDHDYGYGVAVDSGMNAYVTGSTYSDQDSFPVTVGPNMTFTGGSDAFVAKIRGPPSVSGIYPPAGTRGTTVLITNLSGANFVQGAAVTFGRSGCTTFPASAVGYVSEHLLLCLVPIPSDAAAGTWNVTVTNPDASCGTLPGGFVVSDPAAGPIVTAIIPGSGLAGTDVDIPDLRGGNFVPGAGVNLTRTGQANISATGVGWITSWRLSCTLGIPAGAAPGAWNVTVTNPDGRSGTLEGGFTVVAPPAVSAIVPNSGKRGKTVAVTNLSGSNFQAGAKVRLKKGAAVITGKPVTVVNETRITCKFKIPSAAAIGKWDVNVTNPDGRSGVLAKGFKVKA